MFPLHDSRSRTVKRRHWYVWGNEGDCFGPTAFSRRQRWGAGDDG